jgi:ribonucleoside-diphosphate reductase beta chain
VNLRQRYQAITGREFPSVPPAPVPLPASSWNPQYIDLTQDARDWASLDEAERESLLRLTALCQAGDEELALGLVPLLIVMAEEQRLEEELRLTSFLWEEARHVEMFRRFFAEVAPGRADLSRYRTMTYCRVVHDELPSALLRLRTDASPEARAEASVVYNLVVLGMLVETGYRGYRAHIEARGILPGMRVAMAHLEQDATRHIEQSVAQLARLVAEDGGVRDAIERRAAMIGGPALDIVEEALSAGGLDGGAFTARAALRLEGRLQRAIGNTGTPQ